MKNKLGFFKYCYSIDNKEWVTIYSGDWKYGKYNDKIEKITFDEFYKRAKDPYSRWHCGKTFFRHKRYVYNFFADVKIREDKAPFIYIKQNFVKPYEPTISQLQKELTATEYIEFLKDNGICYLKGDIYGKF